MKTFTGRAARAEDAQTYIDWLKQADLDQNNMVDFAVYGYPCINTIVIEADEEPVLINSFHPVLMMEALAPKPGLDPKTEARALRKLYEGVRNIAVASGIKEIWFTCVDPTLHKFIEAKGWKRVTTPIFRMIVGGQNDPLNEERPHGYEKSEI